MYYEIEIVLIIAMLIIGFFDESDLAAVRKWWSGIEGSMRKKNSLMKVKAGNSGKLQHDI